MLGAAKHAGILARKAREFQALSASFGAMLLVVSLSELAVAQPRAGTSAAETWKAAAALATASQTIGDAHIEQGFAPSPPLKAIEPPADGWMAAGAPNLIATPLNPDCVRPRDEDTSAADYADASREEQPGIAPDLQSSAETDSSNDRNEVTRYEEEQRGMPPEQLRSLQQFDSEGELSTPFGMQLREAKRTLKSGPEAAGLLVTAIAKGSPAAAAGLHPYSHSVRDGLVAAAMVGAVFSSGLAVAIIPALDYLQVGESYDLIIGVDGSGVTNFLDFQDHIHNLQSGELIYISVVRNGKRLQLTMRVTSDVLQATN